MSPPADSLLTPNPVGQAALPVALPLNRLPPTPVQSPMRPPPPTARPAFTLIELLVVIGVISILIGILAPALTGAREAARRARCLANLSAIGTGVQVFLNEHKGILPYALPLEDSETNAIVGRPADDGPLGVFGPIVDSTEVFLCPSDESIPEALWRRDGGPGGLHSSYEYLAGSLMLLYERQGDPAPERTATEVYEEDPGLPVMADSLGRHPGAGEEDKNALYYGDWRADVLVIRAREESGQ